jgi:hypothetical protein
VATAALGLECRWSGVPLVWSASLGYMSAAWGNDRRLVFTMSLGTPMDPSNYLHLLQRVLTRACCRDRFEW